MRFHTSQITGTINLASPKTGAYVLTSSFYDSDSFYPDNLIDGRPETFWKSRDEHSPQWIELVWPHPVKIDRVCFREAGMGGLRGYSLSIHEKDEWRLVKRISAPFPAGGLHVIETEVLSAGKIRLDLENTHGFTQLSAIEVYGPEQPLLEIIRPYWNAWHISYPEPGRIHPPREMRRFRKQIEVADSNKLVSAFMQFRANDYYRCFINGTPIAAGSTDIHPVAVLQHLKSGENIIAIESQVLAVQNWGNAQLIAELSLNYEHYSVICGTDRSWKCCNHCPGGWTAIDFDDSDWLESSENYFPPDGLWGRIPYFSTLMPEEIRLDHVSVEPSTVKPGDTVKLKLGLLPVRQLLHDYIFSFELGETGTDIQEGNYLISRVLYEPPAATSTWREGIQQDISLELYVPLHAPHGEVPVILSAWSKTSGRRLVFPGRTDGRLAGLTVKRYAATAVRKRCAQAAVVCKNNHLVLDIDGQVRPPLFWKGFGMTYDKHHDYFATGVKPINIYMRKWLEYDSDEQYRQSLNEFDKALASAVAIDPGALLIAKIDLRPLNNWLAHHQNQLLTGFNGERGPVSFGSGLYAEDCMRGLKRIIAFLKTRPYYRNIIGFMPFTCGEGDSGIGNIPGLLFENDRSRLNIGDYSPAALNDFRGWLRRKYAGSEAAFRRAWKNDTLTFDDAAPDHTEITRAPGNGEIFRDPATDGLMRSDYLEYLGGMTGRFYLKIAGFIKQETRREKLVGVYHLYTLVSFVGAPVPYHLQNCNNNYREMLESRDIDFFACPMSYEYRTHGTVCHTYIPLNTLRRYGKLYVTEEDNRTFIAHIRTHGRQRSIEESAAILKRDLAFVMTRGMGNWFCEFSWTDGRANVGWFQDETLLRIIRTSYREYTELLEYKNEITAEIAVVCSPESIAFQDIYSMPVVHKNLYDRTVLAELTRIGAPFNIHLTGDLHDDRLFKEQYKLIIFLNVFFMDDRTRDRIGALKECGKTFLWFYAQGYIDYSHGACAGNISRLTGITVKRKNAPEHMQYTVTDFSHSLTRNSIPGKCLRLEGFGENDTIPCSDRFRAMHPAALAPVFYVDDPNAVVLAAYPDGKPALALKTDGNSRSLYCAVPYMDEELLRGAAEFAGVHCHVGLDDIYVEASNHLLMLSNLENRDKALTVSLKKPGTVREIYSGRKFIAENACFELTLPAFETYVFRLYGNK